MLPLRRLSLALFLLAAACHQQPKLATPASDQAVFAERYPGRLRDVRARFGEDEAEARRSLEGLRELPARVPAGLADELEQMVRRADAAGRSQPYVDEALRQEDVEALMSEDRGAIRRRVASSVARAAKDAAKDRECWKECQKDEDVDALAGAAAAGTDRAVERQLSARLRAQNPAHAYLQAHTDELGPERVRTLERQADELSRASFIAHVRLALYRLELEDLLDQEKSIRATLQRDEDEARTALQAEGLSKSHRLALEEQVARAETARAQLGTEIDASRSASDDLEKRQSALQRDYEAWLETLLSDLARRQAPPPGGGPASKGARRDVRPGATPS
jgi:hypothetical protein